MKKFLRALFIMGIFSLFSYCTSSIYHVSQFGDIAEIEFLSGYTLQSEILAITDSSVLFMPGIQEKSKMQFSEKIRRIYYTPISNIKSVRVKGFDGSGWGTTVLLMQGLPTVLLAIAAAGAGANPGGAVLIAGIPALATTIFLASSEGKTPEWNNSMDLNCLSQLKIYARYPNGLNLEEVEKILKANDQIRIIKFTNQLQ